MKQVTINIYELEELSTEAQEKAYLEWYASAEYPWYDDNRSTLEKFQELLNGLNVDWEYSTSHGYAQITGGFKYQYSEEMEQMQGVRLFKWLYNNLDNVYLKESDEISLTGFYMDDVILQPIRSFMKRPFNISFCDLVENCLTEWAKQCSNDISSYFSEETFQSEAKELDMHFYESGKIYGYC